MRECFFTRQLNTVSDAYKAQFETPPDIPLRWMMGDYGDFWLDNLNVGHGSYLIGPKEPSFTAKGLHIPTRTGYVEIIIKRPANGPARISEIVDHKIIPR